MDAFQILVIILSVFLAIFLLLGIVLTIVIIKLTKQIQSIAEQADITVRKVASAAVNVSMATNPAYFGRFVGKFMNNLRGKGK